MASGGIGSVPKKATSVALHARMQFYRDFLQGVTTQNNSAEKEKSEKPDEKKTEQPMQLRKRSRGRPSYASMLSYDYGLESSPTESTDGSKSPVPTRTKSGPTEGRPSNFRPSDMDLLAIMEEYPDSYVHGCRSYPTLNVIRDKAWIAVSKKFGSSVEHCKARFKAMRGIYNDERKIGNGKFSKTAFYTKLKLMLKDVPNTKRKCAATNPPELNPVASGSKKQKTASRSNGAPEKLQPSTDTSVESTMTEAATSDKSCDNKPNLHNMRAQAPPVEQRLRDSPSPIAGDKSVQLILTKLDLGSFPRLSPGQCSDVETYDGPSADRKCPMLDESSELALSDKALSLALEADGKGPFSREETLFFQSIALKFRRLNARQRSLLMLKVCNVFHDVEFETDVQHSPL